MVFSLQKLGHDELHDYSSQFVEVVGTYIDALFTRSKNSDNGGGLNEALGGFQPSLVDADALDDEVPGRCAGYECSRCSTSCMPIALFVRSVLLANPVQVVVSNDDEVLDCLVVLYPKHGTRVNPPKRART
jgi:hypothetical protein